MPYRRSHSKRGSRSTGSFARKSRGLRLSKHTRYRSSLQLLAAHNVPKEEMIFEHETTTTMRFQPLIVQTMASRMQNMDLPEVLLQTELSKKFIAIKSLRVFDRELPPVPLLQWSQANPTLASFAKLVHNLLREHYTGVVEYADFANVKTKNYVTEAQSVLDRFRQSGFRVQDLQDSLPEFPTSEQIQALRRSIEPQPPFEWDENDYLL